MLEAALPFGRRSTVLLWEGRIELSDKLPRPFRPVAATMEGGESVRALIEAEAPEAISLLETALADPIARNPMPLDIYDSTAEAFLAKMLEIHPVTAGLFKPQGLPGFRMAGGPAATVDFLAQDLRIAIEVDGPHHFDPVQYRRDRHKDLELQSRGYLILRFLAEDVARDFERIRKTIHRVVHMQCLSRSRSGINVLDESGDTR